MMNSMYNPHEPLCLKKLTVVRDDVSGLGLLTAGGKYSYHSCVCVHTEHN